nr:immunoglobulin heavy chain junction region [Mus musculus]
CERTRGYW